MPKPAVIPAEEPRLPVEPLFALNSGAWLLVWAGMLEASLLTATGIAIYRVGSWGAFWAQPHAPAITLLAVLLALLGSLGWLGRAVLFRRTAYPVLLVAVSWGLMMWLGFLDEAYFFLSTVAVLQAFIFLPVSWATVALATLLLLSTTLNVVFQDRTVALLRDALEQGALPAWLVWSNILSSVAVGAVMVAIIRYIHRANRETALRQRLIEQLEAAQRDLAEREREAGVLEERARLARDLHDTLAQGLASVVTQLSAAELALDGNRDAARKHLTRARDSARANLAEIRRLVWALRPTALEDAPIERALARLVEQWSREQHVAAQLTLEGPAQPLHAHAEVALLRLAQEALSNVARHADARSVRVTLTFERGFVMLAVDDDGHGFDPDERHGGLGLTGMRERAAALKGRVLIDATPGEGASITVALPLSEVAATPEVSV